MHHDGLIDLGGAARLERFGDRLVDRPAVGADGERRDPSAWASAELRYDRERGWSGPASGEGAWTWKIAGLQLELRPTDAGQVGVFPEHAAMLPWLRARPAATILNLFAYTGLATLVLAAAGRTVTHVDAARPSVAWARRNAELSGLTDRPVRWIVDDARTFVEREARRGRRYEGILLDPPTYGHGVCGRPWRLETDLDALLQGCRAILEPGGFVLLTAHTSGFGPAPLAAALRTALRRSADRIETGDLALETPDGRRLDLGSFARTTEEA